MNPATPVMSTFIVGDWIMEIGCWRMDAGMRIELCDPGLDLFYPLRQGRKLPLE